MNKLTNSNKIMKLIYWFILAVMLLCIIGLGIGFMNQESRLSSVVHHECKHGNLKSDTLVKTEDNTSVLIAFIGTGFAMFAFISFGGIYFLVDSKLQSVKEDNEKQRVDNENHTISHNNRFLEIENMFFYKLAVDSKENASEYLSKNEILPFVRNGIKSIGSFASLIIRTNEKESYYNQMIEVLKELDSYIKPNKTKLVGSFEVLNSNQLIEFYHDTLKVVDESDIQLVNDVFQNVLELFCSKKPNT